MSSQKHFDPVLPSFQIAWDATSLKEIMFCPRRYQYTIINGWRSRSESVHLRFGIEYHAALETFDRALGQGHSFSIAEEAALTRVLESSKDWDEETSAKNRFTLIRSVMWYISNYKYDPVTVYVPPGSSPAVELSFTIEGPTFYLQTNTGYREVKTLYCGHIDGLCSMQDQLLVRERKTTGKTLNSGYFDQFHCDVQVDMYSLAGEYLALQPIAGVMVDAAQIAVNFTRFARHVVKKNSSQQAEYKQDLKVVVADALRYADQDYWPRHTRNCWFCEFRSVCASTPEIRPSILDAEFKTMVWEPLTARGE